MVGSVSPTHARACVLADVFPPEALGSPLLMPQFGVVFRGITMHSMLHLCYTRSAGPGDCVRSEDKPRTWQNDAQEVRIQHMALIK